MRRRRLVDEHRVEGVGVHTGVSGSVVLRPADWGTGVVFVVGGARIRADAAHARAERGCTVLVGDGAEVRTPEHLLAALSGLGVTDAELVLDGPEVPIGDGSAQPFVEAIDAAGVEEGPGVEGHTPSERVEVIGFGGRAWLEPGTVRRLSVEVDYGPGGPHGTVDLSLDGDGFREVAAARTFIRAAEVEAARAAGLGRGATEENTVLWPTAALRMPDEPVRHKALDAVGDLALLGPWTGHAGVARGSHRLHLALVRAVVDATRGRGGD